jgi:cation transport ATPase
LRLAVLSRRVGGVSTSRGGYEHADRRRDGNGLHLFGFGDRFPFGFFMAAAHASMGGMGGAMEVPVYFEAASVIIALILLGRMLESSAKGQTGAAIKKLIGLQAKTATCHPQRQRDRNRNRRSYSGTIL